MHRERAPIYYDIKELKQCLADSSPSGLVLANGCFDILHVGHIRYLYGAKKLGDFLLVALNDDSSTRRIKGRHRPVMAESDRAEILAALEMVDAVFVFDSDDVVSILEEIQPSFHAKGTDYDVETVPEIETSRKLGIKCVIVGDSKDHASTRILERINESYHDRGADG